MEISGFWEIDDGQTVRVEVYGKYRGKKVKIFLPLPAVIFKEDKAGAGPVKGRPPKAG